MAFSCEINLKGFATDLTELLFTGERKTRQYHIIIPAKIDDLLPFLLEDLIDGYRALFLSRSY